jgi:hypothetical protein
VRKIASLKEVHILAYQLELFPLEDPEAEADGQSLIWATLPVARQLEAVRQLARVLAQAVTSKRKGEEE